MNDWQYTNQFFEEGRVHYATGGYPKDCPYNYLSDEVDQTNEKEVQAELYRQQEWLAGFHHGYKDQLERKSA
jgi:hypothetical protein